jgi:leucyl-tRNA synthetase
LYSRFFTKFLKDIGLLDFSAVNTTGDEPFLRLLTQGMVLKDGEIMSKSRGNIVDPDSIIKKYGADTLRLYILFAAPPEVEMEWSERGIEGAFRFLNRIWRLLETQNSCLAGRQAKLKTQNAKEVSLKLNKKIHSTIKEVTDDIEGFKFNTAISGIMELVNEIYQNLDTDIGYALRVLTLLISPFVPHLAEEMWQRLGNKESILKAEWPKYDEKFLQEEIATVVIQVNGKVRSKVNVRIDIEEDKLKETVLCDDKVKQWIQNKPIKNFIIVPRKLVNIVI